MKTDIKLVADVHAGEGKIKVMPHFEKNEHLVAIRCFEGLDLGYSKPV